MATSEQSIRVSAKGEFGQLERGLKDLKSDLKGVLGEIDKGARKGGIFDDASFRALDTFKQRFNGTMNDLNSQFAKQNDILDSLHEKMKSANIVDKIGIQDTIKAREKELDVIRKQLFEVEKLYKKRTTEAGNYGIKAPGGSSIPEGDSGFVTSGIAGMLGKVGSMIGGVAKFTLGLAGVGSLISMAQNSYEIAYQRQVSSLDLAQRIRGYGFSGTAHSMYEQVATIGRQDKMGFTEPQSWALQDAYSSRGGALLPNEQYGLQKFARGYGLDATQIGASIGGIKQLGGITQPKEFADMIAGSVSQSGMLPRIMEVMQAHTGLLSSINTTFKDGSSSQILAYQTTLDKLGNENGMTKLTGQQGAGIISGFNGIYQPNSDKWQWTGISALQNYNKDKYGKMGLYDLQASFEDGIQNPDNLPAMVKYLKQQSGGNNNVFKRLMQSWLQDGGYSATKTQVNELDKVTNGFSAFDQSKIEQVLGANKNTDSGTKYDAERKDETGQGILDIEARFNAMLGDIGDKYILPLVTELKSGFTDMLESLTKGKSILDQSKGTLDGILTDVAMIAGVIGIASLAGKVPGILGKFKKPAIAGVAGVEAAGAAAAGKSGMSLLDKFNGTRLGGIIMDKIGSTKIGEKLFEGSSISGALKGSGILTKLLGGGSLLGGALELGSSLYNGDSFGRSASKAGGTVVGMAGGSALGTSVGAMLGGGIGALFGGVGAIPGAAIGGFLGNLVGSIGGGMLGSSAGDKIYEFFNTGGTGGKAATDLMDFAQKGTLDITNFNLQGLEEINQLSEKGLLSFADDAEAIQNFEKTGKLQITSLSEEGAAKLLALEKAGGLSFTSMNDSTLTKLKEIRKDTSDKMEDIYKEHQEMSRTTHSFFDNLFYNIKSFLSFTTTGDKSGKPDPNWHGEDRTGSMSVSANTDVRGNTKSTTAEALNSILGGKLAGHGDDFITAGGLYNIDPTFLAAISMHETGNGSVLNYNNPAGMMKSSGGLMSFDSLKEGIKAEAKNLQDLYINEGLITPTDIQKKYCPVGADNDPTNLNQYWLDGVTKYWQQLVSASGKGTGDSAIGTIGGSVFKDWQNHINSPFGENRGDHTHGGMDLAAEQGTILNALKSGKIAFINVDDGGQYDPDRTANTNAGGNEVGVTMANGMTYFYSHLSKVSDSILNQFESGKEVDVSAGEYIGNSGGTPGVPGSGSSTTGNHLHLGYMDASGQYYDPKDLLNSLNIGDSTAGTTLAQKNMYSHIVVDVNLQGTGAAQLNNSTLTMLKNLITQTVQAYETQKLAMNPTVRRY